MKYIYFILIILTSFFTSYSQDFIVKTDGTMIQAKVDEIGLDVIKYHKYTNLKGAVIVVKKDDVSKIYFDNSVIELYNIKAINHSNLLKELKSSIIENINNYGFIFHSPKQNCRASFEGELLRIKVINKKTNKPDNGLLYDFSTVYSFDGVSKRKNDKAFVNIWVSTLTNEKTKKWKKAKLIIGVQGQNNAESIMRDLKFYNRLLIEEK